MLRWLIVIIVFLLIEIYAFQAFKTASKNGWLTKSYIIINSLVFINLFYRIFNVYLKDLDYSDSHTLFPIPFALFFTLFCFKLILIFSIDLFFVATN